MPNTNDLTSMFPPDFVWGVATSAFQIEGAAFEDGKGESIWDRFCRVPGAIADASNGDVACDHYHRLDADVDLVASLDLDLYRFSTAWPRVQPLGEGAWNEKGLAFYDRLVDGLLARGLAPHLTLNHWDLPQALQDKGGWNSRDTVHRFVDYALGIQRRLGDRLAAITTHNEPWIVAVLGHEQGTFAPGIKSRKVAAQVAHHLLLSHGLALRALRAEGATAKLGIALNLAEQMPVTDSAADKAKAELDDALGRRWFADPLFKGAYPAEVLAEFGADAPVVEAGDMDGIATPMDYVGIKYYRAALSRAAPPIEEKDKPCPRTSMGWEIYPEGLYQLLLQMHRDSQLPATYITENGGAFPRPAYQGHRA